jgi:hypothetical protein
VAAQTLTLTARIKKMSEANTSETLAPATESMEVPESTEHRALRPIGEIIRDLSKPLPDRLVKSKFIKGREIRFITWQTAVRLLDYYAPGWRGEVRDIKEIGGRCVVVFRISIPCTEGLVWRDATGQEADWDEDEEHRYGDPSSNAEAMALKRAAAKFGVALHLYDKAESARR